MNLIFIGAPGSGKGTQAKIIAKILDIPHISTGDLVRAQTGDFGREVHSYIDKGNLVPDELMIKIFEKRLKREDSHKGYILDGFPRNLAQAEELFKIAKIDRIIEIYISDEEAHNRIAGRRNCPKCWRIYNLYTAPIPKQEGLCDNCGGILHEREDQLETVIQHRLDIYHKDTEPIIKKYNAFRINGEQSIEAVKKDILDYISKK